MNQDDSYALSHCFLEGKLMNHTILGEYFSFFFFFRITKHLSRFTRDQTFFLSWKKVFTR
uniref:ORF59b n=1 Tax=Pinus thunbergii TaxID=3350 RepID=Q32972_PINTH|nr:ORF59b [Pinus thunbergii]BAA04402.1 ORF59b [Pinus thunbergii]